MFHMKNLFFALFFALLTACGGGKNSKDEPILAEARKIHKEAMQIHKEVIKDLKKMKEDTQKGLDTLAKKEDAKNKEQAEAAQKKIDAITEQEKSMAEWKNSIQEVPGGEHDHHDHEGHDHKPATQASAQDILAFQKELKKNIEKIQQDVQSILKK